MATFLYCYCGWTDFAQLEKGHRLKKMNAYYKVTIDRCHTPDWARLELEKELKKAGLLAALVAAKKPEVFTGLLWGIYNDDRLEAALLLDQQGLASGVASQCPCQPMPGWVWRQPQSWVKCSWSCGRSA